LISFDQVSKRYPDGTAAVEGLSLTAPDGAITVLVGPSGCGKTTSLRMVNRLIEPSSGRILIDGVDVSGQPAAELRRTIGYVIQHAGLFPHRTVADNIATVPRLLGVGKQEARARARELMELVELDSAMATRYPHQLSGGQQQRVGVARALAADPPVLLMDEPFSAVDPVVRKNLQEQFLRIQSEVGKTILFVTHDIDEAVKLGDRIAVLREGGILAQFATPQELLAHPADEFVEGFLGLDRGVRRLSFFSAANVRLQTEQVLPVSAAGTAPGAAAGEGSWVLLVDADRKPLGWAESGSAASIAAAVSAANAEPAAGAGSAAAHDGSESAAAAGAANSAGAADSAEPVEAPAAAAAAAAAAAVPAPASASADLTGIGHTFTPATDSLRAALDAAVLSPAGWAVGVDEDGRVLGVASQESIAQAIRTAHGREAAAASSAEAAAKTRARTGSPAAPDPAAGPAGPAEAVR
jgi:osmoprotectant transport system ATP-binding protein